MLDYLFIIFDVVSAQKRHGEEVVRVTQGYFSSKEIIDCATKHSEPHAIGNIDNGNDKSNQPLPCHESIGCRPFLLIIAANQESDVSQITQDQLGKRVSQFVSSESSSSPHAPPSSCQKGCAVLPITLMFICKHCQ